MWPEESPTAQAKGKINGRKNIAAGDPLMFNPRLPQPKEGRILGKSQIKARPTAAAAAKKTKPVAKVKADTLMVENGLDR